MGLPWVRLDSAFPRNHKVLALIGSGTAGRSAALVYVFSLSLSGEQGLGGFVPREALPLIHGKASDAKRLVEVGLWCLEPGGWLIHDWDEYQPSAAEVQARRDKARAAAHVRWGQRKGA